MPAPQLVLHPGHGKCGSSTIQYAIYSNIDRLLTDGVHVPNRRFDFPSAGALYLERLGNPVPYLKDLSTEADFARFDERLAKSIEAVRAADGQKVIVSAENLGNAGGVTVLRPVHESLSRHFSDVRVLFYVRRQDEWMCSSWQQWGHKLGWSLTRHVDKGIEDHRPDFLRAALYFEEVYGEGAVQVVPLSSRTLIAGDLLTDFSERAGIERLELPEEELYRNASLGAVVCDVLSRIHGIYDNSRDRSVRERFALLEASRELAFSRDKRLLTRDLRRRIMDHFEPDNRELHARYFADTPFDAVFGLPDDHPDATVQELQARIDGLTDVVAIQMEMILSLLDSHDDREPARSLLASLRRRIRPGGD